MKIFVICNLVNSVIFKHGFASWVYFTLLSRHVTFGMIPAGLFVLRYFGMDVYFPGFKPFSRYCYTSIPPENVRKPEVF